MSTDTEAAAGPATEPGRGPAALDLAAPASDLARARRERFERALGVPFTDGNEIDVLQNGIEIFPAMLREIHRAERTVDLLTFIYWTGQIAIDMAEVVADAAARGVRVRVLLDAVGARPMDEGLIRRMTDAGSDVRLFRPPVRWKFWHIVNRTHRKVLVCDGRVGFTGGVGIAEEWEGDARNPGEWRETHFRIRGPAVAGLEAAFLGNWMEVDPGAVTSTSPSPPSEPAGSSAVQVLRSSPTVGWTDLALAFHTLLGSATRRVRICTPYFVPDDGTVELLAEKARSGLAIELLVPGPHTDYRVAQLAGKAVLGRLLEAGVAVSAYQPTMIHQKILTTDGVVSMIGSGNFNFRSMRHDEELQLVVVDPKLTEQLDEMLDADFRAAEPIRLGEWKRRGVARRALEAASGLLRRQL